MIKNIINNAVFRIFTPIFYGLTIYVLILLIFDRIQQLSENFILIEAVLCLTVTYLLFEFMRLYIKWIERKCPTNCSMFYRISLQGGGCIVISLLLTSVIISFYFKKLVGFNTYRVELVVFNVIYLITSILYNMVYFSFFYLNRINTTQLEQEKILNENLEIELDTYKNKINPGFLYDSLETLIGLANQNPEKADLFIQQLSDVYRNTLSSKKSELANISDEIKVSNTLVGIFNYKLNNMLKFETESLKVYDQFQLISGTLVVILEDILNQSVVSMLQPLIIYSKIENGNLEISHTVQDKIIKEFSKQNEMEQLKTAYQYYGKKTIRIDEQNKIRIYYIPLFEKVKS